MPGLKRIILIDTHLPGVVELNLDGHTNICGTNASGKTTLQRLIPVFYGEYPSRVVPATRDSFEKWYLPRESSFIVYEYTRHAGDLCQVVMASAGNGVNYRFIGKPFDINDYLYRNKTGDHSSVTMNELARALKRSDVLVTKLLNTKEFRAILQNDRGLLTGSANSRELLGYSTVFSLCEPGEHLRHIEKLAKAVHSKEGKMETIKAMIAAILEEDGVQPPSSSLSRNRVEDWIKECHLIKEFDAIRPQFTKLEQADHELNESEIRLAELSRVMTIDSSKLAALIVASEDELDALTLSLKQQESQWNAQRDELNQTLSAARADSEKYEKDLQQVEDEFDNWQQHDIDTLQSNLQKLPQWQRDLEVLDTRYTLLTEKHQDIDAAFNRRLAEVSESLNQELDEYTGQKAQLQDALAEQKAEEQQQLQAIKSDYHEQLKQVEFDYSEQLNSLKIAHAELTSAVKNAGFNEFEQSQLDLLDASIKQASIEEDAAREQLRRCQQQWQEAQRNRQQASNELEQARKTHHEAEQSVSAVENLLYPGEQSLLEFLRKQQPGWEAQLGKVIHPDLLSRTDLAPKLGNAGDSLFGLLLELSALDIPQYAASEQALQGRLTDAQAGVEDALARQNEAELTLAKASELVSQVELQQSRCESACKTAQANRKRAQQDKEQLQSEYAQALTQRKQHARTQLSKNESQQSKCQSQRHNALDTLGEQQREAETEHQFHWQQLLSDTQDKLRQCEHHITVARQRAAADKQQCEQWLANELQNRGVDVDEIGDLQKQIKKLKEDIRFTETNRHKVKDYQHWYTTVFTGHKVTWQKGLAKARKVASDAQRTLEKQDAAFRQLRQSCKEQQLELEQRLATAKEQQQEVQQLLRALAKLPLSETHHSAQAGVSPDTTHSVAQRISEGQALLQSRERLLMDVKAYVEHFDQLIAAQAGTGLSDTWERAREECATTNSQGIRSVDHRRLVTHLAQLLNVIVPQKLHGLREQGRIFGADLTQYYNVLVDIDKRIASQSKRITQEVAGELFLDGVSESSVRIRSRISELEFWPELAQFNRLYGKWLEQGTSDLPSDDYATSMRQVLDILGRAALSGGISKLLDIELHLIEGTSELFIRTDRQLNESSSHGMAYLILCKFLLAFTRLLRGNAAATIHWPIDELGTLHQSNVKKIFDACQNNNICVVGAFPNPESEVLTLFDNRYLIDKVSRKLQVVQPKTSAITEKLRQRKQQNVEAEVSA